MKQIETIGQLREILCEERVRLEGELAGRRSMLDRIVSLIDRIAAPENPAATTAPLVVEHQVPESSRENGKPVKPSPAPRKPRVSARPDNVADQVRTWLAGHGEEFKVIDLVKHFDGRASAVTCAIQKLAASGQILRTGYGRYQRAAKFGTSVGAQYTAFRASLGELKVPEVSAGLGGKAS